VQEAGGRFTDFTGAATAAGGDAIASNGLLHQLVLTALSG
jgi:histidinol-phosphatase